MSFFKKFGMGLLALTVAAAMAIPAAAAEVVDYDSITENLETDFTQAAQLPLTGWFSRTFEDGRSVKAYFSEESSRCRCKYRP